MDSNKDKICNLIVILTLLFRSVGSTNIDCGGKPFHCVNVTHFMICVDMGDGVSKTVDDFTIRCPPPTVCRVNNHFECEYNLPTTTKSSIRSSKITVNFTIDTPITTTISNDIRNTISPLQKTNLENLFNEYYNTTDAVATTHEAFVKDIHTDKQIEITENPKTLFSINDEATAVNVQSNFVTETYPTDNLISNLHEIYSHNNEKLFKNDSFLFIPTKSEKIISEALPDTTSDVTTTNIADTVNNDFSIITPISTSFHDTTTEAVSGDELVFNNQEFIKTARLNESHSVGNTTVLATQTENSEIFTKSPQDIIPIPHTILSNLYPIVTDNSYFNDATTYASDITTQIMKLGTQNENILETNGTLPGIEYNVELTSELNLMEQIGLGKTIDTLNVSEPNIADTTESNFITNDRSNLFFNISYLLSKENFTASYSSLDTTSLPTVGTISTIESTTEYSKHLNNNKILMKTETSPESEFTSTVLNPIALKSKGSDIDTSKYGINKITSIFDGQLTTEYLTEAPVVLLMEKNIYQSLRNPISPVLTDSNKLPKNETLKVPIIRNRITTDDSYLVYPTSSIDYTTPTSIAEKTEKMSHLVNQQTDVTDESFSGGISTSYANIPNLSANIIYLLINDDFTTLSSIKPMDSTTKDIEQLTDKKESFTASSKDENMKGMNSEIGAEVGLNKNVNKSYILDGEKFSATEINRILELHDETSTNTAITTESNVNIMNQRINETVSENSRIFNKTEDFSLPPKQESTMQKNPLKVTEYSYLKVENVTSQLKGNLLSQIMKVIESTPSFNWTYSPEVSYPGEVPGTDTNTWNLSHSNDFLLHNENFSILPSLINLDPSATTAEHLNNTKDVTENSTVLHNNFETNHNISLHDKNFSAIFTEFATISTTETTETLHFNDYIEKSEINQTPSILYNENLMPNVGNVELGNNLVKNEKFDSKININETTTTESEVKTKTSNIVSEFETTKDVLFKVTEQPINDIINNATFSFQDGQTTRSTMLYDILASTDKPIMTKNNALELNLITSKSIYIHDNLLEISTNMTGFLKNAKHNDDHTLIKSLQPKQLSEVVLQTSVSESVNRNSNNDVTTENTYYFDQITKDQSLNDIPNNKYATEIVSENQQGFNNMNDETTTNSFTWKSYHLPTQMSKIDDLVLGPGQLATGSTKKYLNLLTTGNSNVAVVESENKKNLNKLTNTQSNVNLALPMNIPIFANTTVVKLFDQVIRTEIEKKTDNPLQQQQIVNSTEMPFVDTIDSTNVTKETSIYNDMNDFINRQSNAPLVNFPDNSKNNSMKKEDVMNKSDTIITERLTGNDIDLLQATNNNSTVKFIDINNDNLRYNKLNTTKDRISNKRSVLTNSETTPYNISIKIEKYNNSYINTFTDSIENTSIMTKLLLTSTTPSNPTNNIYEDTTSSHKIIKGTVESYLKNEKVNNILQQNLSGTIYDTEGEKYPVISFPKSKTSEQGTNTVNPKVDTNINKVNNTFNNVTPSIPSKYSELVTTESYHKSTVPVLLKDLEQPSSFDDKTSENRTKNYHDLKIIQESNYKFHPFESVNKDERMPIKPSFPSTTNKMILAHNNQVETESWNSTNEGIKDIHSSDNSTAFTCKDRLRGRYADKDDCKKYYICIGRIQPVFGACPANTVFSEIKKQCTKNLSHCIRNNEFRCTRQGRFSDVLRSNNYYICVNNTNAFIRFQFQCQNGFHLNKTSVKCESNMNSHSQMSSSIDSDSNKGSDQSTIARKSKEEKQAKESTEKYICKKEGKFPHAEDCRRYYVCTKNSKSIFRRRAKKCDSDEVFHREKKKCVDRDSYECT